MERRAVTRVLLDLLERTAFEEGILRSGVARRSREGAFLSRGDGATPRVSRVYLSGCAKKSGASAHHHSETDETLPREVLKPPPPASTAKKKAQRAKADERVRRNGVVREGASSSLFIVMRGVISILPILHSAGTGTPGCSRLPSPRDSVDESPSGLGGQARRSVITRTTQGVMPIREIAAGQSPRPAR